MKYNKPDPVDLNTVWAQNATPSNLQRPSDDYIRTAWLQVKPPYQIENWSMNKVHSFAAYINQRGLPEWDNETEYFINSSYVMGSDGRIYKCIQTNTSRNPTTNGNSQYWELTSWDRYATTSKAGIARKATPAQVLAGTDNETYVTPATYKSSLPEIPTPPDATQGNRGMIELATQNETDRGDDDVRAVTPQKLRGYGQNVIIPIAAPTGSVIAHAGNTAPQGYLKCDGREHLRADYPELFAVIGTRFGNGNGSTSFNVPELRGEFIRGWDDGRGTDQNRILGSHQADAFRSHTHSGATSADTHTHSGRTDTDTHNHGGQTNHTGDHTHSLPRDNMGNGRYNMQSLGPSDNNDEDWSNSPATGSAGGHRHSISTDNDSHNHGFTTSSHTHSHSFTTGTENAGGGSETRPRNTALLYIIKT